MEIFLLIVIAGLMIWFQLHLSNKIDRVEQKINDLQRFIREKTIAPPVQEIKKEVIKEAPPATIPKPVSMEKPPVVPVVEQKVPEEKKQEETGQFIPRPIYTPPPVQPKPISKPTFFERNPDLEKFIGENLINKIGIAILVLGIAFFVKYAIDQNWINQFGRVAIGILCGGILLGVAHYMRKRFKAFSSVLVGGGISVLYFTIAIAFHQYHLFDQSVAFIIMVAITGFAIFLSLAYDRIELMVISLIGGFAAPFMVSTGDGNYIVLFTYLMILNIGMLVVAYFKKWNLINILSYAFTILIYGGWLVNKFLYANTPYMGALLFGTGFYLVFFLMNVINNVKEKRAFGSFDFILIISNSFLYYAAGLYILHNIYNGDFQGLFTAVLAIFNFIFAFLLYKRQGIDRNLVFLLVGLVLSFVSLAAPVQLRGHYITLFWSAETVLLLWLSQKSGIKLMKLSSIIVMFLMLMSLFLDWGKIYRPQWVALWTFQLMDIGLNKGFITSTVSIASLFLSVFFLKKESENSFYKWFNLNVYKNALSIIGIVVLYFSILLELWFQLTTRMPFEPACAIILGFYNLIFLTGLNTWGMRRKNGVINIILISLSSLALLIYVFYYNQQIILTRNDFLVGTAATLAEYLFHYLTALSALALTISLFTYMKRAYGLAFEMSILVMWYVTFITVYILSAELSHVLVMLNFSPTSSVADIVDQSVKIGYPILWGLCSFILMILGMRLKMRHLRVISLSLFFITLVKLFVFDIRNVPEGGKIAAFISLGIILLIVSFMYQKLKVLILSDEKEKETPKKDE
jgi:uncharacterized membrane protein